MVVDSAGKMAEPTAGQRDRWTVALKVYWKAVLRVEWWVESWVVCSDYVWVALRADLMDVSLVERRAEMKADQ